MGYVLSYSADRDVIETVRIVAPLHHAHLVTVQTAAELVDLARRNPPQLVIWDTTPSLEDRRALNQWRTTPQLRTVPLLLIVPPDALDQDDLDDLCVTQTLVRPFSNVDLGLRLAALLGHKGVEATPCDSRFLQVGDLILDCNMFQVQVSPSSTMPAAGKRSGEPDGAGNRTISLTPMEFRLLQYLMRSPGRVFTGDHLLARVWEYPEDVGNPDVVRMYIKRLRDKIEPNPRRPIYIKTVPGHGYTIPAPTPSPGDSLVDEPTRRVNGHSTNPAEDDINAVLAAILETTASSRAKLESLLAELGQRPQGVSFTHPRPQPTSGGNGHKNDPGKTIPAAEVLAATYSLAQIVAELGSTLRAETGTLYPPRNNSHPVPSKFSNTGTQQE